MLTWQIDRLLRSGPLCALATFALPISLAILVNSQRTEDNVLGILLVSSGVIFIGSIVGSAVASASGVVLFCLGTVVAEVPVVVMAVVGIGLLWAMIIHDLAGAFHRAPRINPAVWKNAATTAASVAATSAVAFSISYAIAGLATWQSIVVPFGIAAVGFAAKLAADSHRTAALNLTAKRKDQTGNESSN
jgi:hypothetical protein